MSPITRLSIVMAGAMTTASMGCAPGPTRNPDAAPAAPKAAQTGHWVAAAPADTAPKRLPGRAVVVIPEATRDGERLRGGAVDGATGSSDSRVRPGPRRRIDVSLKAADFHNALRLFADTGGFNLVIEGAVGGTVNLELQAVDPFDTLVMVAESKGAAVSVRGSTVVVTGASSAARP